MNCVPPQGYQPLDIHFLPTFLKKLPEISARLGGTSSEWRISKLEDGGNVNLIFIVEGTSGSVCVKQALPYVRLVGESWPLTLDRITFEHECIVEHSRYCQEHLPEIYHYDPQLYSMVMEYLSPHVTMRNGMIDGTYYPSFVEHISDYLARTLFFTSNFALNSEQKRRRTALFCNNTELCKIMEDVVFTDPYQQSEKNRWTSPQLDGLAAAIRQDTPLKLAVSRWKLKYMTSVEALIHGDLHTGSIMITPESTKVIDHEFACYGPIGFDVGNVIGNLLLNYFAQDGYATKEQSRQDYQTWVLKTVEDVWLKFHDKFISLWEKQEHNEVYPTSLFAEYVSQEAMREERKAYLRQVLTDTLGFAAVEMIRRIFSVAHAIDLDWIEPPERRAACETACIRLARDLAINTDSYGSITDVTAKAQQVREIMLQNQEEWIDKPILC